MIVIRCNSRNVYVRIETDMRGADGKPITLWFARKSASDLETVLLNDRLNAQLFTLIEAVRRREYNRGYKHGRAKRAKASWFFSCLQDREYPS